MASYRIHPITEAVLAERERFLKWLQSWTPLDPSARERNERERDYLAEIRRLRLPIPMLLWCPECRARHIDVGVFVTKPHHTHACQSCGHCWRPALVPTVGVQFLPGFRNGVDDAVSITYRGPDE